MSGLFEVGRTYRITTGIGDEKGCSSFIVEAWEPPLLKLKTRWSETIVNTASPDFVSAEKELRSDEKAPNPFDEFGLPNG